MMGNRTYIGFALVLTLALAGCSSWGGSGMQGYTDPAARYPAAYTAPAPASAAVPPEQATVPAPAGVAPTAGYPPANSGPPAATAQNGVYGGVPVQPVGPEARGVQ